MILPIVVGFVVAFLVTSAINIAMGMMQFPALTIVICSSIGAAAGGYYACFRMSNPDIHGRIWMVYGLSHGGIACVNWLWGTEWGSLFSLQEEILYSSLISVGYVIVVLVIGAAVRFFLRGGVPQ